MTQWRDTIITPEQTLLSTIKTIDKSVLQIALVLDDEDHLLGTVTDGDIRRAILKGYSMEQPIHTIMNQNPFSVKPNYDFDEIKAVMTARRIHQVPVVDDDGKVVDLVVIDTLLRNKAKHDNWVVLMAGGLGKRLRPLTENIPKPLVKVGGKPVLENIIVNFIKQGFSRFYISVNYKAEQIKAHFGDGSHLDVEIRYLDEDQALGTAGALSLIKDVPDSPVIIMNGDLVTDVDFAKMLDFHNQQNAVGTMGVREYDFQVEFGVVEIENDKIAVINEKPVHKFLVNAGIYVLAPEMIKEIPVGEKVDMPTMFNDWSSRNQNCTAFPIHEHWLDIGRIEDLERAQKKAEN